MRLVAAEILKLRRRRGTMIWCALLTIGAVLMVVASGDRPLRRICRPAILVCP